MSSFERDRLKNENKEPGEASSLKFIHVPIILISAFLGFGISYLWLRTDKVTISEGDSRTHAVANQGNSPASGDLDPTVLLEKGKQIFTTTCQACHQAGGTGIPGAFPPLVGSEWVTGSPKKMAAIILHGINGEIKVKGETFHGVMPTFKDQLKSEEIAAVETYVRQTFGKTTDTVSTTVVDEVRKKTAERTSAWSGGDEINKESWD